MKLFFYVGDIISVLTSEPIDIFLDYKAPLEGCATGAYVEIPLGKRKVFGVVWGSGSNKFETHKVRSVIRVLEAPPMTIEMKVFLEKLSSYTLAPLSSVLRLATRAPGLGTPEAMKLSYSLSAADIPKLTPARTKVLGFMRNNPGTEFTLSNLVKNCGVSISVIRGLVSIGVVLEIRKAKDVKFPLLNTNTPRQPLTPDQEAAVKKLDFVGDYSAILLKGVTGSGKTEVYLEAISKCISDGQQALVLLPEIGLTSEFLIRVEKRFGVRPAEWHSGISAAERRRVWKMVGLSGVQLVVGARSALFLPFQNLGLIVVDEEHDPSYKQDDGVLYNARDMAVLRGTLCSAKVILASATPSLESWANEKHGKYLGIELKSRYGGAQLPVITSIDMRLEKLARGEWISPSLVLRIQDKINKREQSLLFLNRRGYAPVTLCRSCGMQVNCNQCDSSMVEHKVLNRLMCHQCGNTKFKPKACPSCSSENSLSAVGPGVERLGEEVNRLFPDARVAVLSSDLFPSATDLKVQINQIADGKVDIIIGTQLVAKGHNFPLLTLVGVVDIDIGLQGADLRASERTFQLIQQVSGRAGRADKSGEAFIQTFQPDHHVIKSILNSDPEAFWESEALDRERFKVPPYGRMAGIILSGKNISDVQFIGRYLAKNSNDLREGGIKLYGPAPAPIARIKGQYRERMLVVASKKAPLQVKLIKWISQINSRRGVRIKIDIDPYNFY